MEKVELDFIPTIYKLEERLRLITIQVSNNQDISDDDYDNVLKPLHKLWYEGDLSFWRSVLTEECKSVTQGGLFDDNVTNNS